MIICIFNVTKLLKFVNFAPQFLIQNGSRYTMVVKTGFYSFKTEEFALFFATNS